MRRSFGFLTTGACLVGIAGCGSGLPPTGSVTGKVSTPDKTLTHGMIRFISENGDPSGFRSEIGIDGSYRVSDIPLGDYRIQIETAYLKGLKPSPMKMSAGKGQDGVARKSPEDAVQVLSKYEKADTSGLTYKVIKGNQVKDFTCP